MDVVFFVVFVACGDAVTGFVEYMYTHILPACFIAPLKPSFELSDGQFYLVSQDW